MNIQNFQSILSACEQLLAETKNGIERNILSSATTNLKYALHISRTEKSSQKLDSNKKTGAGLNRDDVKDVLPDPLEKYGTNSDEIYLLGYACKLVLMFEVKSSSSNRNTKALKASLDLVYALLNCGFIPTSLEGAGIHTTGAELDGKGVSSPFLSKLLGTRAASKEATSQVQSEQSQPENIYHSLVDSLLAAAESLSVKIAPERLHESLFLSLKACVSPQFSRAEADSSFVTSGGLNVRGSKLCKIYEVLVGLLAYPSLSTDNTEVSMNALSQTIAQTLQGVIQNKSEGSFEALSLENDVICMISVACNTLGKYSWKRKLPEEQSIQNLSARCLLNFCAAIVQNEYIIQHAKGLPTCLKDQMLPSLLNTFNSTDNNIFVQNLTILQFFCRCSGPFQSLNCGPRVFSNIYLRALRSPRYLEAKKVLICQAIQTHIRQPYDLIYLFLQRDSSGMSTSLLEQLVDCLCVLSTGSTVLPSILSVKQISQSDSMGVFTSTPTCGTYLSAAVVPKVAISDFKRSEPLRRAATSTLIEIVISASQWINVKKKATAVSQSQNHSKPTTNVDDGKDSGSGGLKKFWNGFKEIRLIKEAYKEFLFLFNEVKKPEKAVLALDNLSWIKKCECTSATAENELSDTEHCSDKCKNKKKALFLKHCDGIIDKVVLGEYFSKCLRNQEIQEIFKWWIELHPFKDISIDEALRLFLGGFKLVGEAQVVEKTMELFSAHYWSQNNSAFPSSEAAFILSFSMCMLNTDAHSPHIKNRMRLEEFLQNNRGIDDGRDVDASILQGIYERISQKEIVLRPNMSSTEPLILMLGVSVVEMVIKQSQIADPPEAARDQLAALQNDFCSSIVASDNVAGDGMPSWEWSNPQGNLEIIWEAIGKSIIYTILLAVAEVFQVSEMPTEAGDTDPTKKYRENAENRVHFLGLRNGILHIVRICAYFHMTPLIDWIMENMFFLSHLSHTVRFPAKSPQVEIIASPSRLRLELLVTMINSFRAYGNYFSSRSWTIGYSCMSLLDAVANGIEGWWRRRSGDLAKGLGTMPEAAPDRWFGNLRDVPTSVLTSSTSARAQLLFSIRAATPTTVDVWLEHLFDATQFSSSTRGRLCEGLIGCCKAELKQGRCFSLNKLVEFLTVCELSPGTEAFAPLWRSASEVFVMAGTMPTEISFPALEDVFVLILGWLREETRDLDNDQGALLRPLQEIFCKTRYVDTQLKVLSLLQVVVERSCGALQEGWSTIFLCLRSAAECAVTQPKCYQAGWNGLRAILRQYAQWIEPYFTDCMNCLAAFCRGSGITESSIALESISFTVAASRWLASTPSQPFGQPALTGEDPAAVARWGVLSTSPSPSSSSSSAPTTSGTMTEAMPVGSDAGERAGPREASGSPGPLPAIERKRSGFSNARPAPRLVTTSVAVRLDRWRSVFAFFAEASTHPSSRVRAHALSSMWTAYHRYIPGIERDVREGGLEAGAALLASTPLDWLTEILLPTVASTVYRVPTPGEAGQFDRIDYRCLVQLALNGMIAAAVHLNNDGVTERVRDFSSTLLKRTPITPEHLENDFVPAVLGVCLGLLPSQKQDTPSPHMEGARPIPQHHDQSSQEDETGLHTPPAGRPTAVWSPAKELHPEEEREREDDNDSSDGISALASHPIYTRWIAEFQRLKPFDVKTSKRTIGWEEVQHTPAARGLNAPVAWHTESAKPAASEGGTNPNSPLVTGGKATESEEHNSHIPSARTAILRTFMLEFIGEGLLMKLLSSITLIPSMEAGEEHHEEDKGIEGPSSVSPDHDLHCTTTTPTTTTPTTTTPTTTTPTHMNLVSAKGKDPSALEPSSFSEGKGPVGRHSAQTPTLISSQTSLPRAGFTSNDAYLVAYRQTLLCLCEYVVHTGDVNGLRVVARALERVQSTHPLENDVGLVLLPVTVGAVELILLTRPALFSESDVGHLLMSMVESFFQNLTQSRAYCMESQRRSYQSSARKEYNHHHHHHHPSMLFQAHQFYAFTTVFSAACREWGTHSERHENEVTKKAEDVAEGRLRRHYESGYLLYLLTLKLLLSLCFPSPATFPSSSLTTPFSALLVFVPLDVQLDLVSQLPSVLEETTATAFFQQAWETAGLAGDCPPSFILTDWLQLVKDGLVMGGERAGLSPVSLPVSPANVHTADSATTGLESLSPLEAGVAEREKTSLGRSPPTAVPPRHSSPDRAAAATLHHRTPHLPPGFLRDSFALPSRAASGSAAASVEPGPRSFSESGHWNLQIGVGDGSGAPPSSGVPPLQGRHHHQHHGMGGRGDVSALLGAGGEVEVTRSSSSSFSSASSSPMSTDVRHVSEMVLEGPSAVPDLDDSAVTATVIEATENVEEVTAASPFVITSASEVRGALSGRELSLEAAAGCEISVWETEASSSFLGERKADVEEAESKGFPATTTTVGNTATATTTDDDSNGACLTRVNEYELELEMALADAL